MTSARPTGRTVTGNEYWVQPYGVRRLVFAGPQKIQLEALDYKNNASWCEVAMMTDYNSFPLLIHDFYGEGNLHILNVPNDFGDLCSLPKEVTGFINKVFANGGPYIQSTPRTCMFLYDNDVIGIYSQEPYIADVEVILSARYSAVRDIETGEEITLISDSSKRRFIHEHTVQFKTARVYVPGGTYRFFRLS
jgi:hypothetical protein